MKAGKVVLLVAILGVVGLGNINAQKAKAQKGQNGPKQGQLFKDLTDTQKEQMKDFRVEFTKEITPIKNELAVLEAKLQQASTGDNVSTKTVNVLIDDISKLKADMMKMKFANKQKVRSILTEEQQVMFDAKVGKKQGRGKQGMQAQQCNGQKPNRGGRQEMGPRADRGVEEEAEMM